MPREKRVDAVIAQEPEAVEPGYQPTGPETPPTKIVREPAFYRLHYRQQDGNKTRIHVCYRLADSEKHAVDLVANKLGPVIRIAKYLNRQELIDALPPGRSLRDILPPADLKLAYSLDLIPKTDL